MKELFKAIPIGEQMWLIDSVSNTIMYLVAGRERAMLIDTGMGIGDLAGFARSLTGLPIMVVNTHGHPDHAGGNPAFAEAWMHSADWPIRDRMCSDAFRLGDLRAFNGEDSPEYRLFAGQLVPFAAIPTHPLEAGMLIDLGGRQFEVVGMPGHTPGGIMLLNREEKVLFAGDSIVSTPVWLYLEHSLPLRAYLDALLALQARVDDFEAIYPGHDGTPLGVTIISNLIACVQRALASPGSGEAVTTFAGHGLLLQHGQAKIIYNPQNLG